MIAVRNYYYYFFVCETFGWFFSARTLLKANMDNLCNSNFTVINCYAKPSFSLGFPSSNGCGAHLGPRKHSAASNEAIDSTWKIWPAAEE